MIVFGDHEVGSVRSIFDSVVNLSMKLTKQEKITVKSYDDNASEWSNKQLNPSYWKDELETFSKYLPTGKVIEFGCGGGRDAKPLSDFGYKYLGTDISKGFLKEAKKNNPNLKFIYKTLYKLDFKSNEFDGFWASAVFLHIPKDRMDLVLQNIARIIRPNGVGFISVKEGAGELLENDDVEGLKRLWSYYSLEEFGSLLERNNLKILKKYSKKVSEKTTWLIYFVSNH